MSEVDNWPSVVRYEVWRHCRLQQMGLDVELVGDLRDRCYFIAKGVEDHPEHYHRLCKEAGWLDAEGNPTPKLGP